MSTVPNSSLPFSDNAVNGDTVNGTEWNQLVQTFQTAINDNYARLFKNIKTTDINGNPIATFALDTTHTDLTFKQGNNITFNLDATTGTVTINSSGGTGGSSSSLAKTKEFELVDTASHNVLSYNPTTEDIYILYIYIRNASASAVTMTNLQVSYTDKSGAVQTDIIESNTSVSANSGWWTVPVTIYALVGDVITVSAQAATANAIYISATLWEG